MPELGEFVEATLTSVRPDHSWNVYAPQIVQGWQVVFVPREREDWSEGDIGSFRIFRARPDLRKVWLSDSDFGFEPISDRMRPRYLLSINSLMQLFLPQTSQPPLSETLDALSEAKGIFNRCVKQDQWDWFDVYSGLGRPSWGDLRRAVQIVSSIRKTLLEDQQNGITTLMKKANEIRLDKMLARLLKHIHETYDGLGGRPASARKAKSRSNSSDMPPARWELNLGALDLANKLHEETLSVLFVTLTQMGCLPEYNLFVDCFARLKSGPAIFEVKSINPNNEVSQAREAIAQLYEYRFRHSYPDASLWAVFSQQPLTSWLLPYLLEDRNISVLWNERGKIDGPSYDLLDRNVRPTDLSPRSEHS
jgi:hypothetical protein